MWFKIYPLPTIKLLFALQLSCFATLCAANNEHVILKSAATAASDLNTVCTESPLKEQACVILYFKNADDPKYQWRNNTKPYLRVLKGGSKDGFFLIQDFNSQGEAITNAFWAKSAQYILTTPLNGGDVFIKNNFMIDGLLQYLNPKTGEVTTEQPFVNMKRHGLFKTILVDEPGFEWFLTQKNGDEFHTAEFQNGLKHGSSTTLNAQGQKISESRYKNGLLNGISTTWHSNGKKESEAHYTNGKEDGLNVSWYESGVKKSEIPNLVGNEFGTSKYWYKSGALEKSYFHNNAQLNAISKEIQRDMPQAVFTEYPNATDCRTELIFQRWDEQGLLVEYTRRTYTRDCQIVSLTTKKWNTQGQLISETNK